MFEEFVSRAIDGEFMAACRRNDLDGVGQRVQNSLQERSARQDSILAELTKRAVNGTKNELNEYIEQTFQLPVGLRVHLVSALRSSVKEAVKSINPRNDMSIHCSKENQQFMELLRNWKNGSASPDVLFRHINDMVVNGVLGVIEAHRITNLVLEEGGHSTNQLTLLHGRSQICSALCNMLEMSGVYSGPNSLILHAHNGSYTELRPTQLRRSEIYFTTSTCMQSTPEIWWEHVGASDRLQFLATGGSAASSAMATEEDEGGAFHRDLLSSESNYLMQECSKPTLIIGDAICMQEATIEVGTVIMVDSLSRDCDAPVLRFVILLEGSVSAGNLSGCFLGASFLNSSGAMETCDLYRDGETELNSPHNQGQGSHSSADSNDDENYNSVPPLETQKRYLAVFVSVFDTTPVVECFCPLLDNILHDQIPTTVRMVAPGLAVIAGSNGLLGLVTSSTSSEYTPGLVQHHGGHRSSYSFFNLVEDSLNPELPESFVVSHRGDAAITALAHSVTDTDTAVLVSGDSAGAVCMWEVNTASGVGTLMCAPYHVESEARRIVSVQLSPGAANMAVGLLDRLLLLGVNRPEPGIRLPTSGESNLYVRSCLDMLCGTQARYSVTFFSDCIRIWRVVNEARSPAPPGVSHKSELDSYADTEIDGQPPEPDRAQRTLDGRRSRLGTVYGEEDLGTFSMDPDLQEAVFTEDQPGSSQRGIHLDARGNSPTNPQSPIPPPPAVHTTGPDTAVQYTTGISVTTWLHFNVDAFHKRYATSMAELEERFGAPTAEAKGLSCHRRSGTPTWQEVPTADSPLTELVDMDAPAADAPSAQVGFNRSLSGSSGGDTSSYSADENPVDMANLTAQQVRQMGPASHDIASLNLHSRSSASSSEAQSPNLQYVQLDDEFMPLYAPTYEELTPVPPPHVLAPPMVPRSPQPLNQPDIAPVEVSRAIPGVQVLLGEGVVQFERVDRGDQGGHTAVHIRLPEVLPQRAFLSERNDVERNATAVVLDHTARHHSHFSLYGMVRPFRSFSRRRQPDLRSLQQMLLWFQHDTSEKFQRVRVVLAILCACYQPPSIGIVGAALEVHASEVAKIVQGDLRELLYVSSEDKRSVITLRPQYKNLLKWLCSEDSARVGALFWVDAALGHNVLCSLYLRYCGNKSVAVEHTWQDYLRTYGPTHLRHASRGLRLLTENIRKIDETANIRVHLPRQVGYIVGLYEIYARRVGLRGRIPVELGQLKHLRVLSMGNNHLSGELPASLGQLRNLQRIVLHQNNLRGPVPQALGDLGCIVNLAGNPLLHHGDDVPASERQALVDLYGATRGSAWSTKTFWCTNQPVAKWYKVGVLTSHVHSIVMSSNGMEGKIPASVSQLSYLRMIELATMPGLIGTIPKELCTLSTLRRLCICRCGLTGRIPAEIGKLVCLEELQLFGNQLSGSVPSSISNLTNLKLLSLGEYTGGNNFTSEPLPTCLSSLVSLEALFMANCNIKGPLPDWLGNLTELRQLDLQRNQLSGTVPSSIGKLQNLLYLNIKDNPQLTGRLPLTQLLSLSKLNRLSLVHCNFVDTDYALEALKTHLPRCKVWI